MFRPLLQDLILRLRRHRETPLQEGINGARIVRAAWQGFRTADRGGSESGCPDGTALLAVLTRLVQSGLADARSDVFGLGAVLYEMLTGRPPVRRAPG